MNLLAYLTIVPITLFVVFAGLSYLLGSWAVWLLLGAGVIAWLARTAKETAERQD
jgi:hypothetical protein